MPPITRKDLRYNFLKNIILRLDFQGVFDSEMDCVMRKVKTLAKESGFLKYEEKTASQIGITIGDSELLQNCNNTLNRSNKRTYCFINETRGYRLDISSGYICMNVNSAHYIPFDEYSKIFESLITIFRANIDFFTPKRLGLRKVNECLIPNKNVIYECFNRDCFCYYDDSNADTIMSNHTDVFNIEPYRINLISRLDQGKNIEGDTLYRTQLDIDVYLDAEEDIARVLNDEKIQEMNQLTFDIYIHSLNKNFIEALKSEKDFSFNNIIGVEHNE